MADPTPRLCRSCACPIMPSEYRNGRRTCPACAKKYGKSQRYDAKKPVERWIPRGPMIERPPVVPTRKKDSPRTVRSWWVDAPREAFTATAQQEVPRMRANGITYFSQALNPETGSKLLRKLRADL